jgi:hypothetical protein
MRSLEPIHHEVRSDHRARIDGLAQIVHARRRADDSATAIGTDEILGTHSFGSPISPLQRRDNRTGILRKSDEPGTELYVPA